VYRVEIERRAVKALARLPRQDRIRVAAVIDDLADDPRPAGCTPVRTAEAGTYRVRVGDYHVVYVVLDRERVVIVTKVAKRSEDTYHRV